MKGKIDALFEKLKLMIYLYTYILLSEEAQSNITIDVSEG